MAADTAPGSVNGFTYGNLALLVGAARPGPLRWLEEFLSPPFQLGARDAYAATVTLREASRRYEEVLGHRPQAGAVELDCFVNDSHMIRLPAWASGPDTTTAFQQGLSVVYEVDRASRSVTILSPERNPNARTALMRAVRELAMNHARRDGGMFLHAAAIAVEGRGLLIAGEKRAGKTTLLLHLLRETGADYVSNDRLLLPSADAATLRAMPTIVTVRVDSLAFFPGLEADVQTRAYSYRRTLAEAAEVPQPTRPRSDDSFGLSPAQFCALLGVERRAECAPHALLFPRITGEAGIGRLRDLAPGEAAARVRRTLLSAGLAKTTSDLVTFPGDPPAPDAAHLEEMSRALAARVPCVECQIATSTYERGALAAECLRLLRA